MNAIIATSRTLVSPITAPIRLRLSAIKQALKSIGLIGRLFSKTTTSTGRIYEVKNEIVGHEINEGLYDELVALKEQNLEGLRSFLKKHFENLDERYSIFSGSRLITIEERKALEIVLVTHQTFLEIEDPASDFDALSLGKKQPTYLGKLTALRNKLKKAKKQTIGKGLLATFLMKERMEAKKSWAKESVGILRKELESLQPGEAISNQKLDELDELLDAHAKILDENQFLEVVQDEEGAVSYDQILVQLRVKVSELKK